MIEVSLEVGEDVDDDGGLGATFGCGVGEVGLADFLLPVAFVRFGVGDLLALIPGEGEALSPPSPPPRLRRL